VRTGVLGPDVDAKLKVGRDELQYARLILADACFVFSASRTELVGLGYVVLDAHLNQSIEIQFA
jgi:hypothetical protein